MSDKSCITCGGTFVEEEDASHQLVSVCQSCGALDGDKVSLLYFNEPATFADGSQYLSHSIGKGIERTHYFRMFMAKCNHIVGVLNLPSNIKEQVKSLAELCYDNINLRRMKKAVMLAVCIYYIVKQNNVDFSFRSVASKMNIKQIEFTKGLRKIAKYLNWEGQIEKDALFHVPDICHFISVDKRKTLEDLAFRIDKITKKLLESFGGIPLLYGLALVCVAAEAMPDPPLFDQNLVCKKYGFSSCGLKRLIKVIKGSLLELALKIPWKPTHLSLKNVAMFIDMIEEYENEYTNLESGDHLEQNTNSLSHAKYCLFQQLLSNGCTTEEIKTEGFVTLTKKYLENKSNVDDCDISDTEIDSYLRLPDEIIEETERLEKLKEIEQDIK